MSRPRHLRRLPLLLLALLLAAPGAAEAQTGGPPTALTEALRRAAARFARNEERIKVVYGQRRDPQPLPASLPNPFYRGAELSELAQPQPPEPDDVPAAPDITDADTLARLAPTLRISGFVVRNQQSYLTINTIVCKVGDLIPVTRPDGPPVFLQIRRLSTDSLTLGLNDAELTMPLKR